MSLRQPSEPDGNPYYIGPAYENPDVMGEVVINGEPFQPSKNVRQWKEHAMVLERQLERLRSQRA